MKNVLNAKSIELRSDLLSEQASKSIKQYRNLHLVLYQEHTGPLISVKYIIQYMSVVFRHLQLYTAFCIGPNRPVTSSLRLRKVDYMYSI